MKSFQDLSANDYVRIIRRRIWYVLATAFVVSSMAVLYVWRMPSLYESETTIMVNSRLLPEDYIGTLVRESPADRIESVRQLIRSRSFVERIIQEFQLGNGSQANIEGLINGVLASTEVVMVSGSAFKITYKATNPQRAQAIARRLAERVLALNDTIRKDKVYAADQFLDEEVRRAASELASAEEKVRQFNRQNFPSIPEDQVVTLDTLNNLERELATVSTNLEASTSRRTFLSRRLEEQRQLRIVLQSSQTANPVDAPPHPTLMDLPSTPTDLERRLTLKQAELYAAISRYTPLHPDVVRLTREVTDLEKQVAAQTRPTKETTPQKPEEVPSQTASLPPLDPSDDLIQAEIQLELDKFDAEVAKQQQAKNDLAARISLFRRRLSLPAVLAQQLAALARDVEAARQRYNVLSNKKLSSELAESVDTNQGNALFKILDPANLPLRASWPDRPTFLAVGCLLGLGVGLGVGFLKEFTDSTFADEDEVATQLKMPILACIPTVVLGAPEKQSLKTRPPLALITTGNETNDAATFSLHAADPKLRSVIFGPMTIAAEQCRLVRANLSIMQRQQGLKCLLVASTVPGEGKSFLAACLAGIIAQEGASPVLLIQADMRTISGSKLLGIHQRQGLIGLSEVLAGSATADEAMLKCAELNLFLLPSGKTLSNPTDLLGRTAFEELLSQFRTRFGWIIIDSPPVLALADASILGPLCDAALMIVRAEHTPANLVKDSIQRLGKEHICGVLLNGVRKIKSSSYYEPYYREMKPTKTS